SVRWTDPTGRSWTSPNQHHPVQPIRPAPPLPPPDRYADLSPTKAEEERFLVDAADPSLEGALGDTTLPDETDPGQSEARHTSEDLWTLIEDPTTWHDWPDPTEPFPCSDIED
ncbi:MAG: hypothetical protein QOE84_181, partial [Actinomycetota bacterium]|nr:hypothetical protein [Actinomycetota bacterium]